MGWRETHLSALRHPNGQAEFNERRKAEQGEPAQDAIAAHAGRIDHSPQQWNGLGTAASTFPVPRRSIEARARHAQARRKEVAGEACQRAAQSGIEPLAGDVAERLKALVC